MSSTLYLLDTNTVSYAIAGRSDMLRRKLIEAESNGQLAISVITEAEHLFGFAKKPKAVRQQEAYERFRAGIRVFAWDSAAARSYGVLRQRLNAAGKSLDALDLLIAAHAVSLDAVLISSDKAFEQVRSFVNVVNWATDLK